MLYKILLCAVISLVSAKLEQEKYYLLPEQVIKMEKFSLPCIEKYNADPDSLRNLFEKKLSGDDSSKKFLHCFSVDGKFTDEDGHFNISRMAGVIGNNPLVKPFEAALAECNKITKENPVETVYAMYFCYHDTMPIKFTL